MPQSASARATEVAATCSCGAGGQRSGDDDAGSQGHDGDERDEWTAHGSGSLPMGDGYSSAPDPTSLTRFCEARSLSDADGRGRTPRHPRTDAAHHLVGDGVEQPGPLLRRDLLVTLAADEDDLVADLDVVVAAVDHELVHGHDAQDRPATGTDQHLPADEAQATGTPSA